MGKINPEVKTFFSAYMKKRLRPDTALEVGSGFVLDLVNAFGDRLEPGASPKEGWRAFRPARFLLELQAVHNKFKAAGGGIKGHNELSDIERALSTDNSLLLGSLVEYALSNSDAEAEGEERFQIPAAVADDLETLSR